MRRVASARRRGFGPRRASGRTGPQRLPGHGGFRTNETGIAGSNDPVGGASAQRLRGHGGRLLVRLVSLRLRRAAHRVTAAPAEPVPVVSPLEYEHSGCESRWAPLLGASKAEMCGSAPAPALAPVDTTVLSRYCACKDQPHSQRGLGMLRIALVGHAFPPLRRVAVDTTAPSRYRRRRRSARAPARCGARPPRPPARSCPCGVSHGRARSELDTGPDPHQIRVTHLLLRTSFSSPGPLPSVCTSHGLAPVGGQDCVGGIGALAHTILTLCDEDCFCGV